MKKFLFTRTKLIEALRTFPDLPVLTNGYENGFDNICAPEIIDCFSLEEAEYWEGQFQSIKPITMSDALSPVFKRIQLQRSKNARRSFKAIILRREHKDGGEWWE